MGSEKCLCPQSLPSSNPLARGGIHLDVIFLADIDAAGAGVIRSGDGQALRGAIQGDFPPGRPVGMEHADGPSCGLSQFSLDENGTVPFQMPTT